MSNDSAIPLVLISYSGILAGHRPRPAKPALVGRNRRRILDRCAMLNLVEGSKKAVDVQLTPADLREIETTLSKIEVYGGRRNEERMMAVDQTE